MKNLLNEKYNFLNIFFLFDVNVLDIIILFRFFTLMIIVKQSSTN